MKTLSICLILAAGCSELDPNVGRLYVEPVDVGDAGTADGDGVDGDDSVPPGGISFARDIRPIIDRGGSKDVQPGQGRGCKGCHSRTQATHVGLDLGGFDTTTLGSIRRGGGSTGTRIIVPGKPNESALVQALRGQFGSNRMPKSANGTGYWTDAEIQKVADWIAEGGRGGRLE